MATLIIPKTAVSWKGAKHLKWHLLRAHSHPLDKGPETMSACGFIMDPMVRRPISKLAAHDICRKCLGAMKAKD